MDDVQQIVRLCRALGVEPRIQILSHLRGRALCVGALAARLDVTQSAVSQHLRILRDAGLVSAERRGYFTHYRLNEAAVLHCVEITKRLFIGHIETERDDAELKGGEKVCPRRKASAKNRRI